MLQLTITPATASQDDLVKAVSILNSYIDADRKPLEIRLEARHAQSLAAAVHATATASAAIHPDDNPAAGSPCAVEAFKGAPEQSTLDPAAAFGTVVGAGFTTDPALAFGAPGNVPAAPAPFIAGAAQPSIAPEATPGISTSPTASLPSAPASASAAPIVAAPVPPGPTNAPGVDVDAAGLPWDGRIHSSSKEKNKTDSKWRARRGVDAGVVATVEAELRAVMAAPGAPGNVPPAGTLSVSSPTPVSAPAALPTVPPAPAVAALSGNVPNVPPPPMHGNPAAPIATQIVSATSPATVLPVSSAPAPSGLPLGYPELAQKITAGLAGKTLTAEQITAACQSVQIPAFPLLATRPDLVPAVAAALGLA